MLLKRRLDRPGLAVSALVHAGALAATLIAFSSSEKFDDLQETVPVDVITDNQFNQIMKGDKSADKVRPDAKAEVEPTPEAAQPPPPPEPPHEAPAPLPKAVQAPPPPPPPTPPVRPSPPEQAEATPPVPTPPVRDLEAEAVIPKPVPKPVPKPPTPHPAVAKAHDVKPPPPPKPHPVDKPKIDQLAKLLTTETPQEAPAPTPKPSIRKPKPTPAPPVAEEHKFDLTDITKLLLGHDSPSPKPSTNHDLSHLASLGSPTASAAKMSPSFWAGLDGLLEDQYRSCWSYLGLSAGSKYIPQVRVVYGVDGSLQGQPVLINPPSDPALQSLADSALRAVRKCNPLKIPEQYAPYYDQWRGRVLRFDPEEMAG